MTVILTRGYRWAGRSTVCSSNACRGLPGKRTVLPCSRWAWTWPVGSRSTTDDGRLWCMSSAHVPPTSAAQGPGRTVPSVVCSCTLCSRRSNYAGSRTRCYTAAWSAGPSVWKSCACLFPRSAQSHYKHRHQYIVNGIVYFTVSDSNVTQILQITVTRLFFQLRCSGNFITFYLK